MTDERPCPYCQDTGIFERARPCPCRGGGECSGRVCVDGWLYVKVACKHGQETRHELDGIQRAIEVRTS